MKSIVLIALFATVALSSAQEPSSPIPIISQDGQVNADGSYSYSFETGNDIKVSQTGELKQIGDVKAVVMTGQFEYPGETGPIQVSYVADENGFQPQGDHLPVAPPVPEAIARSLAYLATAPPQPEGQ